LKLRKTKSTLAVLLAVMLLVSTMIVAPVSASAATAGESVGDEYYKRIYASDTNLVYYGFSATGLEADAVWSNTPAPVNIEKSDYDTGFDNLKITYSTANIEVPAGMSHIHVALKAGYDLGNDRYYKMDSSQSPAWAAWGEEDLPHIGFYDSDNSRANIVISVLPESKIAFRYVRFQDYGNQLVYTCQMTELPPTASETTKLGDVAITVEPESAPYSDSRDVTINVTNIDSRIPLDEINVDYAFDKGTFTPANTSKDTTNHTITVTGTLSGFSADDIGNDYEATATAETDFIYYDQGQHKVIGFEATPATDTYDIEDTPVVEPTVENKYITVDLSVSPDTIQENQSATLTAIVHYPDEMPEGWGTQYVGVTVSDDGGTNVLTPDTTSNDANNHQNVYTFILNENKYSVSDSPVMFSALATYSGTDYAASPTLTYHFDITPPAFATLTVTNPSYENENVPVGTLDVSVTPASDYNSAARTVTAVLSDISQFIDNTDDINVTMTDSKGNTLTNPAVTIGTDTVTYVYTVAANTYPNAADTVTYTGTASCDQTKTVDYTIYSFTPCSDTADTEIIIDTLDPELTPDAIMLTLLSSLKTSIGVKTANLAGYENVYMVVSIPEASITETITDSYTNSIYTAFDFNRIHPQILGDDFSAVVYGTKNGVEYHGNPYVNNVRDYSYRLLERIADSTTPRNIAQKALLVELLNYAASIQLWKGYKTDELANARLTAEQQAYSSYTSDCENKVNKNYVPRDNAVATWYQQRLVFDSNIKLDISFQTTVMPQDGWYVIAKANGVEHRIDTILRPGPETGQLQSFYYVTLDDLMANQLDSEVLVTLYDENNNPLSSTMMTTINSFYVNNMDSLPANQVAVLEAMVKYGRAAMALSENP